jgi:hypothetical protein
LPKKIDDALARGLEIRDHPGFAAGINGQVSVQPNETNH